MSYSWLGKVDSGANFGNNWENKNKQQKSLDSFSLDLSEVFKFVIGSSGPILELSWHHSVQYCIISS